MLLETISAVSRVEEQDALECAVLDTIRAGSTDSDDRFGALALRVHAFQRRWNVPYANYCRELGGGPPTRWQDIPAVPQSVFKHFFLRTFSEHETVRTFRTSGTTGEGYGSHHFRSLELYEASILAGWRFFGLPTGRQQLVLTPDPASHPHSSLAHMMGTLSALAPSGGQTFGLRADGGLDLRGIIDRVETARRENRPHLLLGTALAFLHLCESLDAPLVLPAGTEMMETGGYKGTGRTLAKSDLYATFQRSLGLPADAVINEYGMTELSTPFYTRGLGRPHAGPPWARALVIDPETGREVAEGEIGTVRLFDLANVGSVLAIQTQDLAVRREGGTFELLGRDPAALPRGCSRAADEMLSPMPRIELATTIHAPLERVFDLARSLDLHAESMASTGERAVAGKTTGLFDPGDEVTWEARHFGVRQRLTSRMNGYDRPRHFRDTMVRGAFRRFDHDHFFTAADAGTTVMRDVFDFDAPLGPLGWLANVLFLTRYMRGFLLLRNETLKAVAESTDRWQRYLPAVN